MGDYYDFEIRVIEGVERFGFIYQNESTGWNEIFVQFTGSQAMQANIIQKKFDALELEQKELIKSWIN